MSNDPNPTDDSALSSDSTELSGSGLAAEKARRLDRLAEMRAAGVEPYPYRFDRTHTLTEARAAW
ncbi:MAG: lysine--tRNA ligase, partial [Actinobacteria bacterium]|nr:lysine--tRNA ligase [Actinomycetota bacterium]